MDNVGLMMPASAAQQGRNRRSTAGARRAWRRDVRYRPSGLRMM